MKERKVRQKGFLALLLVAIIVLGMPGMTVFANSYHINNVQTGMVLSGGDTVHTDVVSSGSFYLINGTSYGDPELDQDRGNDRDLTVTIPSGNWLVNSKEIGNTSRLYISTASAPPVLPPFKPFILFAVNTIIAF